MDRVALEQFLGEGLSLAEIGRRVGRHEATVGYWVQKHGLEAVNRGRHAARGGIARETLTPLVEAGMSTAQIAVAVGLSKTTVRHWLREFGMSTEWAARREASQAGRPSMMLACPRHGMTVFRRRTNGGYHCASCGAEAVSRRRRKVKRILVDEVGGGCALCGYDRCIAPLEFHHLAPAEKRFTLSRRGVTRSLEKARAEARKCALLCANCHAEVEAPVATLAHADSGQYNAFRSPASHAG